MSDMYILPPKYILYYYCLFRNAHPYTTSNACNPHYVLLSIVRKFVISTCHAILIKHHGRASGKRSFRTDPRIQPQPCPRPDRIVFPLLYTHTATTTSLRCCSENKRDDFHLHFLSLSYQRRS